MDREIFKRLEGWFDEGCPETEFTISVSIDGTGRIRVRHDRNIGLLIPAVAGGGRVAELACNGFVKLLAERDARTGREVADLILEEADEARRMLRGTDYGELAARMAGSGKGTC